MVDFWLDQSARYLVLLPYAGHCGWRGGGQCRRNALFNIPGESRGAFCKKHRDEDTMVNVKLGRLVVDGAQGTRGDVEQDNKVGDERQEEFGKIIWLVEPYKLVDY